MKVEPSSSPAATLRKRYDVLRYAAEGVVAAGIELLLTATPGYTPEEHTFRNALNRLETALWPGLDPEHRARAIANHREIGLPVMYDEEDER